VRALVDTSALIAVTRQRDQYHARARPIAEAYRAAGGRYVGTTLVLGETYSHVLYDLGPRLAQEYAASLLDDPAYEWVDATLTLVRDALSNWLDRFRDQRFSLVDAVSFEVMRRQKITHAFAFDRHFEVAGFKLLR
jgi:hypothetical protein